MVAEYVESEEIRSAVISLGIDYMQGYLIGEPLPLSETLEKQVPDELTPAEIYAAISGELSSSILSRQPVTASQYCCSFSRSSSTSAFWLNQSCGKRKVQWLSSVIRVKVGGVVVA